MKITIEIEVPDEDIAAIELRPDGDMRNDDVVRLWDSASGPEAIGSTAYESFYVAVRDARINTKKS